MNHPALVYEVFSPCFLTPGFYWWVYVGAPCSRIGPTLYAAWLAAGCEGQYLRIEEGVTA